MLHAVESVIHIGASDWQYVYASCPHGLSVGGGNPACHAHIYAQRHNVQEKIYLMVALFMLRYVIIFTAREKED